MDVVNIIYFESKIIIREQKDLLKFENANELITKRDINLYTSTISQVIKHVIKNNKYHNIFKHNFDGNGLLAGGTYINTIDNIFENHVVLYNGDIRISEQVTVDGKFNFKHLNTSLNYDIKATPLNSDFNPKIVANIEPVIDNACFKFLFYCYYDKIYNKSIDYEIKTSVNDTRGTLKYNVDNAPIGLSIDENTGVISFNISTIGVYNFTVNCSDSLLELTKSIPMEIEIV